MKFQAPKVETKEEYIARSVKEEGQSAVYMGLLEAFGARGPISRRPTYNKPSEIMRRAERDFRNCDFSGAMDYLESMQALYEETDSYLDEMLRFLEKEGYEPDEDGYPIPKD